MDDDQIRGRIETLEAEERRLRSDEAEAADRAATETIDADRERLAQIKVELDQLWDLLRQRQALRSAGKNPDDAHLRDSGTVEGYLG